MRVEASLIALAVLALVITLAWLLPGLTQPTLQFGVRVPPERAEDPVIAAARRGYRAWVAAGGLTVLAVGVALALAAPPGVLPALAPLAVLVPLPGYLRARRLVLAAKRDQDWYRGLRQAVVADTTLRTAPTRFPWLWALPALAVLGFTAVAGVLRYPRMPATLVAHFGADGRPDRLVPKSVNAAFFPVYSQALTTALIIGALALALRSRPDLDPAAPVESAARHRAFLRSVGRALLLLAAGVNLAMLAVCWQIWDGATTGPSGWLYAPSLLGVALVLAVAARAGQGGSRLGAAPGARPTPARPGLVQRDDDQFWRGGLLYVNRADPALLVPKRFGVGWTVNFGNPRGLALLALILALAVVVPLILAR